MTHQSEQQLKLDWKARATFVALTVCIPNPFQLCHMLTRLWTFWTWLSGLLGFRSKTRGNLSLAPKSYNPDADYKPSLDDVPRYPPFDRGLPAISIDDLLTSQNTLVERVRDSQLPYAEEAVRNLARYVHLLPATSNDFFCGAGGLFRLCLEIGFHSFIASQGNIFTSRDPAEKRRELEAKWQLAAFLAGMCCELSRAIVTSVVTNDHGDQWLPFEPLADWMDRTKSHRYFLRPPQSLTLKEDHETEHLSGVIVNAIIPAEALRYLTTDDRSILMAMLSSITRLTESYNRGQFPKTVRLVRDQVITRDKRTNPITFGKPLVGVHVEPYLINAMRHLVRDKVWKVNEKMARVHIATDGAYIFWTTGVQEILKLLREEGAVGIPSDPRTLGERLMQEGIFEKNDQGGLWWYVKTPLAAAVHEVVKLSNPGLILDDDTLASVQIYPDPIAVDQPSAGGPPGAAPDAGDGAATLLIQAEAVAEAGGASQSSGPAAAAPAAMPSAPGKSQKDYSKVLSISSSVKAPSEGEPAVENAAPKTGGGAAKPSAQKDGKAKPKAASGGGATAPSSPSASFLNDLDPNEGPSAGAERVVEVKVVEAVTDHIASKLKRASLITEFRSYVATHNACGANDSPFFWNEHGLCIPRAYLSQQGSDPNIVANFLSEQRCLHIDPGEVTRFVNPWRDGKQVRCVCILTDVALSFGFLRHPEGSAGGGSTVVVPEVVPSDEVAVAVAIADVDEIDEFGEET